MQFEASLPLLFLKDVHLTGADHLARLTAAQDGNRITGLVKTRPSSDLDQGTRYLFFINSVNQIEI